MLPHCIFCYSVPSTVDNSSNQYPPIFQRLIFFIGYVCVDVISESLFWKLWKNIFFCSFNSYVGVSSVPYQITLTVLNPGCPGPAWLLYLMSAFPAVFSLSALPGSYSLLT
jgi:hypothetical protein